MSGAGLVLGLLFAVIGVSLVIVKLWPKSPDRNLIVTSLVLTVCCIYLMWAVPYMAQLHPLVTPKRTVQHV
ncbi:hypothetical protein GGF31_003918 [Allomyces arbusculus]|nr:hypothetical protein GGF31_003918 [Allomyces arbusculus]